MSRYSHHHHHTRAIEMGLIDSMESNANEDLKNLATLRAQAETANKIVAGAPGPLYQFPAIHAMSGWGEQTDRPDEAHGSSIITPGPEYLHMAVTPARSYDNFYIMRRCGAPPFHNLKRIAYRVKFWFDSITDYQNCNVFEFEIQYGNGNKVFNLAWQAYFPGRYWRPFHYNPGVDSKWVDLPDPPQLDLSKLAEGQPLVADVDFTVDEASGYKEHSAMANDGSRLTYSHFDDPALDKPGNPYFNVAVQIGSKKDFKPVAGKCTCDYTVG